MKLEGVNYIQIFSDNWLDILKKYSDFSHTENILIADTFKIIDYNQKHPNTTFIIMKKRLVGFYGGILTYGCRFLKETIASAIADLSENGILQRELAEMYDIKHLRPQAEPNEPKVLTLAHLAIGFKLYGITIAFTIAVYIVEFVKRFVAAFS